jgi:hypothetical protein
MSRTDYGKLFISTGGAIVAGAAVCLVAGTIGLGGFLAALAAAWIVLICVNSMDRADRSSRQ